MMKIVLLLALTVAVYSFSIDAISRSTTSRKSLRKRSLGDILAKRSSFDVIDKYDINNDHKLDSIELELLAFDHGIEWPLSATYAENLVEYNDLNGDKALDRWEFSRNPSAGIPFYQ